MDFTAFNWFDLIIIVVVGISCLMSLWRGLLKEAMSLIIWTASFLSAMTFSDLLIPYFSPIFTNQTICYGICFVLTFFMTLVAGTLLSFALGQLIMVTGLAGIDRLLGGVFGFLRGMLIVTALVTLLSMTSIVSQSFWASSVLLPVFTNLSKQIIEWIPSEIGHYLGAGLDSSSLSEVYTKINSSTDAEKTSVAEPLG